MRRVMHKTIDELFGLAGYVPATGFGVLGAWKAKILDTAQATGDASELLDTLGVGLWKELGAECATWQHIIVPPDWKTLGSISLKIKS